MPPCRTPRSCSTTPRCRSSSTARSAPASASGGVAGTFDALTPAQRDRHHAGRHGACHRRLEARRGVQLRLLELLAPDCGRQPAGVGGGRPRNQTGVGAISADGTLKGTCRARDLQRRISRRWRRQDEGHARRDPGRAAEHHRQAEGAGHVRLRQVAGRLRRRRLPAPAPRPAAAPAPAPAPAPAARRARGHRQAHRPVGLERLRCHAVARHQRHRDRAR